MKKLEIIVSILCISFFAWFIISYADILIHQNHGGTDAVWNFFNIVFG